MILDASANIFVRPITGKKRGIRPKSRVDLTWSADFAYAIGLIVSDGNFSFVLG